VTRSLKVLPVDVIRRKFAKALGVRLGKIPAKVELSKGFFFEMPAIVTELKVAHLSALVDLIHEYDLDGSTVYRGEYGIVVVLKKKVEVCHPEDSE
jgi:hypothetical protein